MMGRFDKDVRLDPRVRAFVENIQFQKSEDVKSRDEIMAQAATKEFQMTLYALQKISDMCDDETIAPKEGLKIYTKQVASSPDNNLINLQVIRPDNDQPLPGLVYFHGGGMRMLSCFDGNYKCWGRMLAHNDLVVVMVDFRNSIIPSSVPEIGVFPAGLNDCVSAVKWVHDNSDLLGIGTSEVFISGESGGGNLALSTAMKLLKDGEINKIAGVYSLCPLISGKWPREEYPSSVENNGILLDVHDNHTAMSYGIKELEQGNPLAWPHFAKIEDVQGLPPVMISVNECDPLRDEGVAFYRLLLSGKKWYLLTRE